MKKTTNNIISFFISHPIFFQYVISNYYPINRKQFLKYQNFILRDSMLRNIHIKWNSEFLSLFKSQEDWQSLSPNPSVFKNILLIDEFYKYIQWNDTEPDLFSTIAFNTGIPWTIELLNKYESKWDYKQMSHNVSIPWSESLIDKYFDDWDWSGLVMNEKLPWTNPFIDKYLSKITPHTNLFKSNPTVTGNFEIVQKYGRLMDWMSICMNSHLPWYEKNLIELWGDKINWVGISGNELLASDGEFFQNNLEKWFLNDRCFLLLSLNKALPWSIEFIDRFLDFWNWEGINQNPSLPWSIDFIERYANNLYWGKNRTYARMFDENGVETDEPFETIVSFEMGLESNEGLPWSLDFIQHYESKIDMKWLGYNQTAWEKAFKPYVDDKVIDTVMSII